MNSSINKVHKYKFTKYCYLFFKRLFDIIIALIGIVLLIPLTIILKIAYMCTGDFHSIFFVQDRIGKNGKHFKLLKYRSMVKNAEAKLEELMQNDKNIRDEYTKNKKLEKDPRITPIGKFIRRFSIDELPQFINVFIGSMSVVGPRPYLPREKDDMGKFYNNIITCKPGVTGLWQVSGRSDLSFKKRLRLEKEYAEKCCFKLDTKIFFKTFGAVIGFIGAK